MHRSTVTTLDSPGVRKAMFIFEDGLAKRRAKESK